MIYGVGTLRTDYIRFFFLLWTAGRREAHEEGRIGLACVCMPEGFGALGHGVFSSISLIIVIP